MPINTDEPNQLRLFLMVLMLLAVGGCSSTGKQPTPEESRATVTATSLDTSLRTLQTIAPHLQLLDQDFLALPDPAAQSRDYFTATEVDNIEGLLFEFTASQTSLWDMVDAYGGLNATFADSRNGAQAEVLASVASLLIASHTALVVTAFADRPLTIKQLNEAYYRSEIPFGSYDRMRETVTNPDMLEEVRTAKTVFTRELADPQSALAQLAASDPAYSDLIDTIPALQQQTEQRLQEVAGYFPSYKEARRITRKDEKAQHKTRYAFRSWVFKEVSRLKNPTAHVVKFTPEQKARVFDLLEPGDLILTYTAGYMSDVFIPGAFKHGITYVGTPDARRSLDLSPGLLPADQRVRAAKLAKDLQQTSLPDGRQANMIEAVAEGVILNDLGYIMETHINRMLVLRPKMDDAQRARFLVEVYSYLGDQYDFRFDFADASNQVCTEVIYRGLNNKGGIQFPLTVRAGHETLSADDVANYYLHINPDAFELILLVESIPDSKARAANLFVGSDAQQPLATLMEQVGK